MTDEQKQDIENPEVELGEQELQESVDDITQQIAALEEQLAASKDQLLRMTAEIQNTRRRAEQDVEKAHKFALEKFALELLPVLDSLERGVELSNTEHESVVAIKEGMELTLKIFKDVLKKFQIEEVNPEGEPFNPDTQQAMAMEPNDNVEPNTVLKVFQKGYMLSGRLLRPAMVVVSRAS